MLNRFLALATGLSLVVGAAPAAIAINPEDIAIVGDLGYQTDFHSVDPALDHLRLDEIELSYQGYLSPSSRADVFLSIHPGATVGSFELEPEEAYITLLELPGQMGLRLGKYKASFGKLNRFHPEQWFYIDRPLVLQNFLGEDGLQDLGAELSIPIPNPWDAFVQLNAGVLNGSNDNAFTHGGVTSRAANFRLSTSANIGDDAYLEGGLSGAAGTATTSTGVGSSILGAVDATYRWRPDKTTSFTTTGEVVGNRRPSDGASSGLPTGFYLMTDYQFATIHDLGIRVDQSWKIDPSSELDRAVSVFYDFAPAEINRYKIQLTHAWTYNGGPAAVPTEDNRLLAQVLFTMGPHKHPVQF